MSLITRINKRFNYKLLSDFIKQKNISLSQDYSNIKLNRDSIINGSCSGCLLETYNKFNNMIKKDDLLCKTCTIKNAQKKSKITCMERFGVEYSLQSEVVKQKTKDTNMRLLGVENPFESKEVQQKIKDSCKAIYGVEYVSQCEVVKQKKKDTNMRLRGVEYPMQSIEVQGKSQETCMERYGVEYASQCEVVKQKMKDTNMKLYGVENPMQNPEIAERCMLAGFDYKNYTLPSGKIIHYQGYENFGIRDLLNSGIDEKDIINDKINVPEIWYDYEEKRRRYYVDIFIPSQNKCIEIKSKYTLNIKKDNVLLKQKATKELGYKCEIWVYNKNGIKIECIV